MHSLPVERSPLWPKLTCDIWKEDRCQRGRRWDTKVIGQILLGDAEAECSFELLPQSRVKLGVIKCCCCAPVGQEKDENLFSASKQKEDDLKRPAPQTTVFAVH